MKATEAINKIKSIRTTFLRQDVQKYNYPTEIREQLQKMSEQNEITPLEYYKALKITWDQMKNWDSLKAAEYAEL